MKIQCSNGHRYEADEYTACPVCATPIECARCGQALQYHRSCSRCGLDFDYQFVQERAEAREMPNLRVWLGAAPDGLPWVLHIRRGAGYGRDFALAVENIKAQVRAAIRNEISLLWVYEPEGLTTAINDFGQRLERELVGLQVCEQTLDDGTRIAGLVTRQTVNRVVGETFLSALLTGASRTDTLYAPPVPGAARSAVSATFPNTAAAAQREEAQVKLRELQEEMRHDKRLLLDTQGDKLYVAKVKGDDLSSLSAIKAFIPESLLGLPRIQAVITDRRARDAQQVIELRDQDVYQSGMIRAGHQSRRVKYSFATQDLGGLMVGLAARLGETHRAGKAHCDLKPQNILLTANGLISFDSMDVALGDISLAHTLQWASPEQITSRPISPASDVYSLALIWLKCLNGAPYGEESTFTLPVFGKTSEEFKAVKILKNPFVYVPAREGQSVQWQLAWQDFFCRCFSYEPEERIADGAALADALEELLQSHPIPGFRSVTPYWGKPEFYCFEPPRLSLGWGVSD